MPENFSISVRLRRVVVEEGYVNVPVSDEVMQPEPAEDGMFRLDGEKVFAAAVKIEPPGGWLRESVEIEVHPIQKAPDDSSTESDPG